MKTAFASISSGFAFALLAALPASAQTLTGKVTSAEEGAMEGVLVSAKKTGSTITVTVVSDATGRYSLPGGQARSRPIRGPHPRHRLRSRPPRHGRDRRAAACEPRPQAAQDRRPRRADVERRMARELPGHRPAEERDARLRRLPHGRAHRALHPHRRRIHQHHAAAHAGLREPEHPGAPATAQG